MNDSVPHHWTQQLASAIAGALQEFATQIGTESMAMLALDCHPWHGRIGISALTTKEIAADSTLNDPAEMAAWRFFDFANDFDSWKTATDLGQRMKSAYDSGDRPVVVEAFFIACAAAITSDVVVNALDRITRDDGFKLSVAHPDNGREFVFGGI